MTRRNSRSRRLVKFPRCVEHVVGTQEHREPFSIGPDDEWKHGGMELIEDFRGRAAKVCGVPTCPARLQSAISGVGGAEGVAASPAD